MLNLAFSKRTWLLLLIVVAALSLNAYTFGQNKVNVVDSKWSMIRSMHFDLYFPAGNDDFGRLVSLMSEEIYYRLKEDLRFPIRTRIPLIVYETQKEFLNTNIIYPLLTEGIGGFTESLRNRVVVPFEGSYPKLEELLVHELTHAYTNALDRSSTGLLRYMRPHSFPFWFSEGLPEFLSIGGEDDFNNMFILDMVINDRMRPLEYSEGYLAYRMGESFLKFIADEWGREKVGEYYFALRNARSTEEATNQVFGMDFSQLERRWHFYLKKLYYPSVSLYDAPTDKMEQRTFSIKDGSYFNYMPRFSPDGNSYIYFSNAGARYSIWLSSTHGLSAPKKLITGERNGKMQEFYYYRANLSWFPDSRSVAFTAKETRGDVIHILDTHRAKIVQSIRIDSLNAIYEVDVSPDGSKLLICGNHGLQSDIFVYDLESETLERITDDHYWDAQARWAPDGASIVFASERILDAEGKREGFFANYRIGIFSLNLESGELRKINDEDEQCSYPMYVQSTDKIMYLSNIEGVNNYRIVDLANEQKADVTNILAGVYTGDISADARYLVVSNYFDGAWDIYFDYNPLDSLQWRPYDANTVWMQDSDLLSDIDLSRLDYFGPRPKRSRSTASEPNINPRRPQLTPLESLLAKQDYSFDDKPTAPSSKPPKVDKYRSSLAIDQLWGGLAYSSSMGAVGFIETGLSDIMGNHAIGLSAGLSGEWEENNLILSYLYLKKRTDLGFGAFNIFDDVVFKDDSGNQAEYYRYIQRETGLLLLLRYPFSRFMRLELEQSIQQRKNRWDKWKEHGNRGDWIQYSDPVYSWVSSPGISLVHDTALWGSTGPLQGIRSNTGISASFSGTNFDYLTAYTDLRSYTLFNKRYGFAARLFAGTSTDFQDNEKALYYNLYGFNGVRGHDSEDYGHNKLLGSLELRFPFFEYIAMNFPVPLTIPNIRGTMFFDVGTVCNDWKKVRVMQNGALKDLKLGFGFGPRINLGYVVFRVDVAWATDFKRNSKPMYYVSLIEDF
ncbi:MAG TPA: hypothetical protein DCQ12_05900 [Candidatus Cloacimonas sp.]|nr:hypothetical protein [Candidatus Cloacimonas sp.]